MVEKTKDEFNIYLINEKDSVTLLIIEENNNNKINYICNFSLEEIVQINKIFYSHNNKIELLIEYLTNILEKNIITINKHIINLILSINENEIKIEFTLSKISSNYIKNINYAIKIKNNKINIIENKLIKYENNNINKNELLYSMIEKNQKKFENQMNKQFFFNSDPRKLTFNTEITQNCSCARWTVTHSFDVFKSIFDEYLIVYGNNSKNYSIEFYNITNKKLNENLTINNPHSDKIVNIKHYYYELNKQDFILSSSQDKSIKLWELFSLKNLLTINHFSESIYILCEMIFFNDRIQNDYYIITSADQELKIWNKQGENIKTFTHENSYLNKYYENFKYYIIHGNEGKIGIRDIENGEIIHKYGENDDKGYHWVEITSIYDKKRVIGAHYHDGYLKIFDYDSEKLVKKFPYEKTEHNFSFCLWNEKYILVGYIYSIRLFNIDEGTMVKELDGKFSGWGILTIYKFYHPTLGDCLIGNDHDGKINILTIS